MIKSETGSGKTLAYLIPIVQILQSLPTKIDRTSGVYCVILVLHENYVSKSKRPLRNSFFPSSGSFLQ